MSFHLPKRSAVAATAATLASLLGAGAAVATDTPPAASLQAGPLAGSVNATGPVSVGVTSALGGPLGASTAPSSASAHADLGMSSQLDSLQGRLSVARQQVTTAADSGRSAARARVRSLRRQATRLAKRIQARAIGRARAATDGAWLLVNSQGIVIDQSGGMTVSQVGAGTYDVSFGSGAPTCLSGAGNSRVEVTSPSGPVDGGFFLTTAC